MQCVFFSIVQLIPFEADRVYEVEVTRTFNLQCSSGSPSDVVFWQRKHTNNICTSYLCFRLFSCFLYLGLSSNETNETVVLSPGEISPFENFGGPVPTPFIINFNSSEAQLDGDNFNGTQPEDAGIYVCVLNGEVRETVEIVVQGMPSLRVSRDWYNWINYFFYLLIVPESPSSKAFFRLSSFSLEESNVFNFTSVEDALLALSNTVSCVPHR